MFASAMANTQFSIYCLIGSGSTEQFMDFFRDIQVYRSFAGRLRRICCSVCIGRPDDRPARYLSSVPFPDSEHYTPPRHCKSQK